MAAGHMAPDWMNFHDPTGKFTLKHQGAYPVVEVRVSHQDKVLAEAGAMLSMHGDVDLDITTKGSSGGCCAKSCLCCCADENFYQTEFYPKPEVPQNVGLDVLLGPRLPGNIVMLHLTGQDFWRLEPGAYLCGDPTVQIGVEVQGISKGCCGGEGFFLLKAEGQGRMCISAYGSILRLAPSIVFL